MEYLKISDDILEVKELQVNHIKKAKIIDRIAQLEEMLITWKDMLAILEAK